MTTLPRKITSSPGLRPRGYQVRRNENHNGILRRYIPKKTDFSTFTQTELDAIIHEINNRPRKCLNWETSNEAFHRELQLVKKSLNSP